MVFHCMKRIFLTALAVMVLSALNAKIKHPSLLFTPKVVAEAKDRVNIDTVQANACKSIMEKADHLLDKNDVRQMEYLALAYQLTGDEKYAEKLRTMLLDVVEIESWADSEMMQRSPAWRSELQMAHKAFQLAVAYDAVYNELSVSDRNTIAKGLWRLVGEPLVGDWLLDPTRIHSLNSMGHNWWSSCVGMGALLSLAISNEISEAGKAAQMAVDALPEWFGFAGDVIQNKPKSFDSAGGMYESINYASFGITEALILRLAWLNSHPGAKLEAIPQMELLPSFFSHVCYPRIGQLHSINFGDSHKNVTGESSMLLAYAMGVRDPNTLWYVTQIEPGQHREGFPRHFPMGFLYTPDLSKAPATPDLPLSHLWEDFGWATMRDSWGKDATMLAVKSGMTWNHSHADANSLILFHNGTDIIKDAGNCSYGKPEYRNYFFQTDAHNVVKFNGEGQPKYQQYHGTMLPGSMSTLLDGGNIRYVLADGTGPMSHVFDRNLRHYLWIDSVIYVIDDIHSHKPGQFEWLWHPGGETKKRGGDLEISNGNSAAVIRPLYPQPLAPSNYVHDYPEMMYWEVREGSKEDLSGMEEYWSFKLPGETDRIKGLTAIILKDSPAQKNLPKMERREGKNWIGLRVTCNGKVTDLYINQLADGRLMHLNSWIDADGWITDAYMFAVSYPEGGNPATTDELFVCHGSSLKRGGDIYLSSLSKLSLATHPHDKKLTISASGQPRLKFKLKASPSSLTINGKSSKISKEGNLIAIDTKQP